MIDLPYIANFFPSALQQKPGAAKYFIKEYLQLMVLDYLSSTPHIRKLIFIGGTNLRLIKHINRFSEDLDFDCRQMSKDEFMTMTDDVITFLNRSGLTVEAKDKESAQLSAYRRSLYFPQLLFDLKLSGHREERFLIKVEAQDKGITYAPEMANVKGCGFFFALPVPGDEVLLSMKIAALLQRGKGRDFYDVMFLLAQTTPNYDFLKQKLNISSSKELRSALMDLCKRTNLKVKKNDFVHLLFDEREADKILRFEEFVREIM